VITDGVITDGELRELFQRKADDVEINRAMPAELVKRVRRRQRLIALTSTAALLGLAAAVWIGAAPRLRSEAIPPADDRGIPAVEDEMHVEGLEPTADRLAGIWLKDQGVNLEANPLLLRIRGDGTAAFDNGGLLDKNPAVRATYVRDGDSLTFTDVGGDACETGDNWTWRMGVQSEGRMNIVSLEDGAGNCSIGLGTKWSFTRVSPISQATAQITAQDSAGKGAPPSQRMLQGIWLEEGRAASGPAPRRRGTNLLRFAWDETYAIDDGGMLGIYPDDAGSFEMYGGTLRFTSASDSRTCNAGAVTVWKQVRLSGRTLRAVVAKDECGGSVGAELTWILLSP
jgi:hypothetical protein